MKNFPKYSASYLRSVYGMNATLEEAYGYLPKGDDGVNYSWLILFDEMWNDKASIIKEARFARSGPPAFLEHTNFTTGRRFISGHRPSLARPDPTRCVAVFLPEMV